MWLVVVEGSADAAASHFECFFHLDDNPAEPDRSGDAAKAEGFEDEEPALALILRAACEAIPLHRA
jgi:hypothetical protein